MAHNNEIDHTFVSREESEKQHEDYEFACRVAGEVVAHIGERWPEPKPEHDFVIACPGGYLHKDGGEACRFIDTDLILIVGQMEAEDLCAGRNDTHRAVKVSVYLDLIEKGWK